MIPGSASAKHKKAQGPDPEAPVLVIGFPSFSTGTVRWSCFDRFALVNSSTNFIKYNDNQSYYFRLRSTTNEHGQLVSAFYRKIRSYIGFGVRGNDTGTIQFTYYLNPTPNDRNLEFDPKKNLFTDLKSTEEVREP